MHVCACISSYLCHKLQASFFHSEYEKREISSKEDPYTCLVRFVIMLLEKLVTLIISTKLTISLQAGKKVKNVTGIGYCQHIYQKVCLKPVEFFLSHTVPGSKLLN